LKNLFHLKGLLWLDALTAILSGSIGLLFATSLSEILALPHQLLTVLSWLSFCFAGFAIYLARQNTTPLSWAQKFVLANWVWVFVCAVLLVILFKNTNVLGLLYLSVQSLFVALLSILQGQQIKKKA
jgi:hypothetical protein